MSEQVKNAIDLGLNGLCVNEGSVAEIMRRVRAEGRARPDERARQPVNWRMGLALAAVLVVLVAAVTLRLAGTDVPDLTPLSQPDAQSTEVPAGFVPVEEKEPEINIDANQAVKLAEDHVLMEHDGTVNLRDGAAYAIRCEYVERETADGAVYRGFYAVRFVALTIEGTEYALRVSAEDGSILTCEEKRGAAPGHTAQEIYAGYARVYGTDRRLWTNEQLRTYCTTLRKAAPGSMRWEDYLYLLSGYPEVAENAMTREEIIAAVESSLDMLRFEHVDALRQGYWHSIQPVGQSRARYISAYPVPVWKVAVDCEIVTADGYAFLGTLLIETDSVSGVVKHVETVDALYASQHESFTRSNIDALSATNTSGTSPSVPDDECLRIAADYIRDRWGEGRDVNDEALFTCTEVYGDSAAMQVEEHLVYRSTGEGDVTEYVVVIDWYGRVIAANRSVTPAGESSFTPVATHADWNCENLLAWQAAAAQCPRANEPEYQVFLGTVWLGDRVEGTPKAVQNAALRAIDAKATTRIMSVQIDAEPNPVWKVAVESDQGEFLIELDSATLEPLHVLRVEGLYQSWYLPFVLTADLRAAGAEIPADASPVYLSDATEKHGTTDDMRVDHLYERFKQLYGPNMGQWSPAQLRSFQQMAMLSSDYDYDLGVPCLRHTVYPDVPSNAIPPETAMVGAVEAIGDGGSLETWRLSGAVLIGTTADSEAHGTPVWKLCLQEAGGGFWYAEVNCITGQVYRLHQDAEGAASPGASYDYGTPQNLWFRDIVLEDVIEDCDAVWDCRGNG